MAKIIAEFKCLEQVLETGKRRRSYIATYQLLESGVVEKSTSIRTVRGKANHFFPAGISAGRFHEMAKTLVLVTNIDPVRS